MKHLDRSICALLATQVFLAAAAGAQVQVSTVRPLTATQLIDFDVPFVIGLISSTSAVFTTPGIASVTQIGTFTFKGDDLTAGENVSGQTLVSYNGVMKVRPPTSRLDDLAPGAGWEIRFTKPTSVFGVRFVDDIDFVYDVTLDTGLGYQASSSFTYAGPYPQPAQYWSGTASFDRITITFPNGAAGLGLDDLCFEGQYPGFTTYCTGKTNSYGCQPWISASGTPSATAPSGFVIYGHAIQDNKFGRLLYTVNGSQASIPFSCGTLCIGPNLIKYAKATNSLGDPPPAYDCSGTFSTDMNAFAQGYLGGPPPAPELSVPGTIVHCQWYGEDPGYPAPCNTTLTDAGEYFVLP